MKQQYFLHSDWKFSDSKSGRCFAAEVPGCIHTDLLRHKLIPDPFYGRNELELQWIEEREWKYETEFDVPASLLEHQNIELVADGLDTVATVTLNGQKIGRVENMFLGHEWPAKKLLEVKKNRLDILFHSPMDYIKTRRRNHRPKEWNDPVGGASRIRKMQCSFGWDWGPRFATCGIYKSLYLRAWSSNRIHSVEILQNHRNDRVDLEFKAKLAFAKRGKLQGHVLRQGRVVAEIKGSRATIRNPQLWWPNGHGEQPLYDIDLELIHEGRVLDRWQRRIGLRTIQLDRHPDKWGESFQFKVNNRVIFCKGANWIPAHSFVTTVTRAQYDELLTAAKTANMNMIRAWGGGIYEMEDFFDLCDEKGLLVWQDFMFACTLAPADKAFLASVRKEAEYQITRLRHRACLALWCGNNELVWLNGNALKDKKGRSWKEYGRLFHQLLPDAVKAHGDNTPYWPTSPHNPLPGGEEKSGDAHFWDVWHGGAPVKYYENKQFRFCSEFGMQSYNSPEIAATYCPPEDLNIFSATIENHQKNNGGNRTIFNYLSQRYRFPKDYASLAYLSQLNQAYCMKIAVEHFRRSMPRTMGALFWQLNDCWPAASWSSLEFGGRWRALHYEARRFFSPALVSAHVHGDVSSGIGNYSKNTVSRVDLYTVYDAPVSVKALLHWELRHLDGSILWSRQRRAQLRYGASVKQASIDLRQELKKHLPENLYLAVSLEIEQKIVSRQTVLFTQPRFLPLSAPRIEVTLACGPNQTRRLVFKARHYAHQVCFHLPGIPYQASDNFFDLWPGDARSIDISTTANISDQEIHRRLSIVSLSETY